MIELGEVVQSLAARAGVEAVLLAQRRRPRRSSTPPAAAFDSETVAALAATLAQHAGRLGQGAGAGRSCAPPCSSTPAAPGAGAARARTTGSRSSPPPTPTSAPCSTICASIARRWPRCSDAVGRPPGGGSGTRFWPLSTPQHPKQLLPLSGSGSTRGRGGRTPHRPDPARAHPGGGRRRARGPAPDAAQSSGRQLSGRAARGVDRPGADLGHLGGAPARPRRRGAVAPRRLGRRRRGRVPPDRRRARSRPRARTTGWSPSAWCPRVPRPATATSCPARRWTMAPAPWRGSPRSRMRPPRSTSWRRARSGTAGCSPGPPTACWPRSRAHTPEVAPRLPALDARRRRPVLRDGHADLDRRRACSSGAAPSRS